MQKSIFWTFLVLLADLILRFSQGFPVQTHEPLLDTTSTSVPEFLMEVRDCWKSLESDQNQDSCLPIKTDLDLSDVNAVRAIKGKASVTNSVGFYSHSPDHSPLPPSLTYTFKMHPQRTLEELQYAYVQISKLPISPEELEIINHQCSGSVSLQLLSKLSSTNDSLFTLLSSATLSSSDFGGALEVKFSGITAQFAHWQQTLGLQQEREVEMRLVIAEEDTCYSAFTPHNFGFRTNSTGSIVVLTNNEDIKGDGFDGGFLRTSVPRGKRSAFEDLDYFNLSSDYHYSRCRLYAINMSLELLGVEEGLISDPIYQANICAGSCDFPPGGETNHSYFLGSISRLYDDLVPPPCCVPNTLTSHSIIYEQNTGDILALRWDNMIATSCGCQ